LNPVTGYLSPQSHCIYDDRFDTPARDKNFSDFRARRSGLAESSDEPPIDFDSTNYAHKTIPQHFQVPFEPSNESQVEFNDNVSPDNPEAEVGVDDGNNNTLPNLRLLSRLAHTP
jgi:hypothetical protein